MRYIDWADVVNRYSDVARIGGAESVSSSHLQFAEAEVDARLSVLYTVPFTPAPPLVKDLCIDLTYWRMTMRQKGSEVIKKYIDERIEGLIGGTIVLTDAAGAVLPQNQESLAWSEQNQTGYHTAFGPDYELNWMPSSAYIADVDETRGAL